MSKVISTVQRAETKSVRDDFNASTGLVYLSAEYDDQDQIDSWNDRVAFSPQQTRDILLRDLPDDISVNIYLDSYGNGSFYYNGSAIQDVKCEFDLQKGISQEGDVYINDDDRAKGVGRIIVRNQIEFLKACGVECFKTYASSSMGGYVWARFGFLPNDDQLEELRQNLDRYFKGVKDLLTAEEIAEIEPLLSLENKEDIWKVAESKVDLQTRLHDIFDMCANESVSDDKRHDAEYARTIMGRALNTYAYNYIRSGVEEGHSIKLACLLLMGTNWHGEIDAGNDDQMRQVDSYTGGFKHIAIK